MPLHYKFTYTINRIIRNNCIIQLSSLQCSDVIECEAVVKYYAEKKNKDLFKLILSKWTILREIAYILSIPYKASLALQKQQLTLSDVFGIWLKMELHLNACTNNENFQTGLAGNLLDAINARKKRLFDTPMMSAALYLDPRYRNQIINDEPKMNEAKLQLITIWRKMLTLAEPTEQETAKNDSLNDNQTISFKYDAQEELDKYLSGVAVTGKVVSVLSNEVDIEHIIDTFNPTPIKSNENILKWWEQNKMTHPEIYKLSTVVYAAAPTEVQIEKDFSKLNFIFTDRRYKLMQQRLEDIMMIHLNAEMFNIVKKEEQDELLSLSD